MIHQIIYSFLNKVRIKTSIRILYYMHLHCSLVKISQLYRSLFFLSPGDKCDKMVKESGKSLQKLFALHRESSKKTILVRWFAHNHGRVRTRMTDEMTRGSTNKNSAMIFTRLRSRFKKENQFHIVFL